MDYGRCRILSTWVDWDYAIHTNEAQIGRQGRAMTYPFSFKLNKKDKSARFSSTSDLPYYETTLTTCDCYDFQRRKLPCKHIYRLAVELKIIEIIRRASRPSFNKELVAEVRESVDVDIHPEQIKRQKSAMDKKCTPSEINYDNKAAIFLGSGKSPYTTTTETITILDDFINDKLEKPHKKYNGKLDNDSCDEITEILKNCEKIFE